MSTHEHKLNIVLVGTLYSVNIGASARAGANMGAHRLILVNPRSELNKKARQGAAGAQKLLNNITIYNSLDAFYNTEGEGFRIGFTRRPGMLRQDEFYVRQVQKITKEKPDVLSQDIYLFFGPEDNGLSNDDLSLMNLRCALPTFGEFFSLNLAQAVLLALYITQNEIILNQPSAQVSSGPLNLNSKVSENKTKLFFPEESLREWLIQLGFDISSRKNNAFIVLKRLLLSTVPNNKELSVLRSVLQQNIRILRESRSKKET